MLAGALPATAQLQQEEDAIMDATPVGTGKRKSAVVYAGNRLLHRRYGIQLELQWKLIRRTHLLDTGNGRTIDLSAGGILFEIGRHVSVGSHVELSINWPVPGDSAQPMQLVVSGYVIRAGHYRAAIRMVRHQFLSLETPATQTAPGH